MNLLRLNSGHPRRTFDRIAAIHLKSIHHGALPHFGPAFMSGLYSELASAPRTAVWAAMEGKQIVGFLAGCADLLGCYASVFLHGGPSLILRALPSLRRGAALKKLSPLLFYPFRRRAESAEKKEDGGKSHPSAELLAIALEPEARGKGVGKALILEFEAALAGWHVGEYGVTTNSTDADSNAFYARMGFSTAGRFPHHDLILQRYCKKTPAQSGTKGRS